MITITLLTLALSQPVNDLCHARALGYKAIAAQRDIGMPIDRHMDYVTGITINQGMDYGYRYGMAVLQVYSQYKGLSPDDIYKLIYTNCVNESPKAT